MNTDGLPLIPKSIRYIYIWHLPSLVLRDALKELSADLIQQRYLVLIVISVNIVQFDLYLHLKFLYLILYTLIDPLIVKFLLFDHFQLFFSGRVRVEYYVVQVTLHLDRFSYFFKLLIDFLLLYPPAKDLTLNIQKWNIRKYENLVHLGEMEYRSKGTKTFIYIHIDGIFSVYIVIILLWDSTKLKFEPIFR